MNSCCLQHVALVNILLPSPLILFWQIGFIVSKVLTVKNIISSQVFLVLIICLFSPMAQYSGSWLMAGVRALLWGFWVRPPAPSSRLSHLWTLGGWWEQGGGRWGIIYCSENRHVIDNHFIKVFSVCYYFYLTAMTTVSQVNIELVLSPYSTFQTTTLLACKQILPFLLMIRNLFQSLSRKTFS